MRISVSGVRLFVDVINPCLVETDGVVAQRPAMLFLHGGPGFDHLSLRPQYEPLADVAQLFFFDHRGNGRSDPSEPKYWSLERWAKDVAELIDALGLHRPIVFGQSFGGVVAQRFAIDFPGTYAGLILSSTLSCFDLDRVVANFETLHGAELADLARRYFSTRTDQVAEEYNRRCFPLYTVSNVSLGSASIRRPEVAAHFFANGGEGLSFDLRSSLHRICAPTLIIGGDRDPVVPVAAVEDTMRCFSNGIAELVIFENCGHGPARDQPLHTLTRVRDFVRRLTAKSLSMNGREPA